MKIIAVLAAVSALLFVCVTQAHCEEPKVLSQLDLARLDAASSHIREVWLAAQAAIASHQAVIAEICKSYKIEPCNIDVNALDKRIDMKTGAIKPIVKTAAQEAAARAAANAKPPAKGKKEGTP
jgi:hypothetical protein